MTQSMLHKITSDASFLQTAAAQTVELTPATVVSAQLPVAVFACVSILVNFILYAKIGTRRARRKANVLPSLAV